MKITIETNETKVTIEEYFTTIDELLSVYKRCAIALTFHEDSWNDAILNEADEIAFMLFIGQQLNEIYENNN